MPYCTTLFSSGGGGGIPDTYLKIGNRPTKKKANWNSVNWKLKKNNKGEVAVLLL